MHWRCENEGHWTADAIHNEDARRTPWSKHPDGILATSLLRILAHNILAVMRALSRRINDHGTHEKLAWREVIEHLLLSICKPTLLTEEFDAVEA
jgi:hypothetical protein